MVDAADRRELFEALERQLGPRPATTLMELLPPLGWADVARRSDLVAVRGEMAVLGGELRAEMAGLRGQLRTGMADLRGEMGGLRGELRAEAAGLRGEMAGLRSDMKEGIGRLFSRFDRLYSKLVLTFVPLMFATAALVLGAARLA